MRILFLLLVSIMISPNVLFSQIYKWEDDKGVIHFSENPPTGRVEKKATAKEDSKYQYEKTYEEYKKEEQDKMEENVGKRFIALPTDSLFKAVFYDGPDTNERKFTVKTREAFLILEIVHDKRSDYFDSYKVKFDSGKICYVRIHGFPNWDDFIRFGSIVPVSDRVSSKESQKEISEKKFGLPKDPVYKAVELVKNHPTLPDPDTGKMRSVEKRMIDARKSFFPNMIWRYEATVTEKDKYRVTQYVDNGREESFIRTWIVNLSTNEVSPENMAAKKLYY